MVYTGACNFQYYDNLYGDDIEMLMDIMVQPFKYLHRDAFTTECILLKDIIYSLVLASEKRGHLILKSYYTREDTVIKNHVKSVLQNIERPSFWFLS